MIRIEPVASQSKGSETVVLPDLALSVCDALRRYPHYVLVQGCPALADQTRMVALAMAVRFASYPVGTSLADIQRDRVASFAKVRIDREGAATVKNVTRFSLTESPLDPHTDTSYMARPYELIALQCIVPDQTGGETTAIPVEDVITRLGEDVTALLGDGVYPFGKANYPIISGIEGREEIRYYHAQIDCRLEEDGRRLSKEHRVALDTLKSLLAQDKLPCRFRMRAGEILFMDNRKALHGRTGFSPRSRRLFYRVRLRAPGLRSLGSG